MPREVIDTLMRDLRRDIVANYPVGAHYRSLENIGTTFRVSRKTAHKAVGRLAKEGLVTARPRVGITIVSHKPQQSLTGKHVTVFSDLHDRGAEESILRGVQDIAQPQCVNVFLLHNPMRDTRTLGLGDLLLGLATDGVIAVSFGDAALGFYRAMREGLDIVADYDLPELPILPVVQADFFKYGEIAGRAMAQQGRREILVAGYPSLDDSNCYRERFEGLCSALDQSAANIQYVSLVEPEAFTQINRFLYTPAPEKAVFSIEFGSNKILAAQFIHNHVPIDVVGFGVFVSPENEFIYPGLPPIPSYSPSLRDLGRALATRLFEKWRTGTFGEPFVELL